MAKKSDVFGGKSRLFRLFCRIFNAFCRRNSGEVLCIVRERILDLVIEDCKMQKMAGFSLWKGRNALSEFLKVSGLYEV